MIVAGLLLMLKKDVDWIQPPSQRGVSTGQPVISMERLLDAARSVEGAGIDRWVDLDRVDFKPGKGMVKFVSESGMEVQVDTHTGTVLQVARRRSDVIEALHDGSYFADWTKLGLFLPVGVALLVLWCTGLYLFFLPHVKRWQKRRKRRARRAAMSQGAGSQRAGPVERRAAE